MSKQRKDDQFDVAFEKTDFGSLVKKPRVIKARGRKKIGTKIALILPDEILEEVKKMADEKSIGYQTLIRMLFLEKFKEEKKKSA